MQPGELVHRHPLPAGQYWVTAVQARLGLLPYLRLIDEVDDMPVRGERFADDCQLADARLESQFLTELAPEGRIQRLVALQPAARQHPVALTAFVVLDQQDPTVLGDDRRHPQLWRDRVKRVHQHPAPAAPAPGPWIRVSNAVLHEHAFESER